jgi:hypothetical protein
MRRGPHQKFPKAIMVLARGSLAEMIKGTEAAAERIFLPSAFAMKVSLTSWL